MASELAWHHDDLDALTDKTGKHLNATGELLRKPKATKEARDEADEQKRVAR